MIRQFRARISHHGSKLKRTLDPLLTTICHLFCAACHLLGGGAVALREHVERGAILRHDHESHFGLRKPWCSRNRSKSCSLLKYPRIFFISRKPSSICFFASSILSMIASALLTALINFSIKKRGTRIEVPRKEFTH